MWKPTIDQKCAALFLKLITEDGLSVDEAAAVARRDLKQRRIEKRKVKVTDAVPKKTDR